MRLAFDRLAVVVHDADTVFREHGDIAIGEEKYVAGVLEQRGNVAGHKIFAFAKADDGGRSEARSNNFIGITGREKNQRVDSAQLLSDLRTASSRGILPLPPLPCRFFSTRCATISVSVSVMNLWPSRCSVL